MLIESYMLTESIHALWKMAKVIVLYVSRNKPEYWSKGWRGKVVRVLHFKAGVETYVAKHIMLLRQVKEEWTPTVLKTFSSKSISGSLEAKVEEKQIQQGNFSPIKDKSGWQVK